MPTEREKSIYKRAEDMAQTGLYAGWVHIQFVLVNGGMDAERVLKSKAKRDWLDRLCAQHYKEPAG